MVKTYIGIDNGITGSIGIIRANSPPRYIKTPTIKQQDYTKTKQQITRIDVKRLLNILNYEKNESDIFIVLERPMVNPQRFKATKSALRALEATLSVIESLSIPYQFCDSKEWQKMFLPSAGKKKAEQDILKKESIDIGKRIFPQLSVEIDKQKDADGILIAEWARRSNL